ncbi:MAG: HAD family hydrolase [Pseudonocardiaceae bacterium]
MSRLPTPAAVLLDLDGTLVDTVGHRINAWLRAFAEGHLPASREHVATLIGSDGRRLARKVARVAGHRLDAARAELLDRRAGEIYETINRDPQPLPGVRALLAELDRRQIRWAIATSSRREQVMASVEALGLGSVPEIVDGSHVQRAKPDPELLLLGARELGADPPRCWYVGDATWDMLAATAAGMVAVGVTAGAAVDGAALRDAGAATVVATLEELVPLLGPDRVG